MQNKAHWSKQESAHKNVQLLWICAMLDFCLFYLNGMVYENEKDTTMIKDANHGRSLLRVTFLGLRYGWLVLILLGILWFPFDWLSEVWPMFGIPFRQIFHNAHDHFVGHTVFFFIIGMFILNIMPALRRRLHWYILGLIIAALVQETIQACFRGQFPTFTDFNAFQGDALGGMGAWMLWFVLRLLYVYRKRRKE